MMPQMPCHYTFSYLPIYRDEGCPFRKGLLRGGAGIAGCALQMLHWWGVRDIVVCGMDMSTNKYFDGTVNPDRGETSKWATQRCR